RAAVSRQPVHQLGLLPDPHRQGRLLHARAPGRPWPGRRPTPPMRAERSPVVRGPPADPFRTRPRRRGPTPPRHGRRGIAHNDSMPGRSESTRTTAGADEAREDSVRRAELLAKLIAYSAEHGLSDMSL